MNMKKAIKFLENHLKIHKDWRDEEILKCLKQGEKYQLMWERCKKHNSYDGYVGKIMNEFEQKYFPKESDLEYNGEEK